jgi:sialic acid synthase SpsE
LSDDDGRPTFSSTAMSTGEQIENARYIFEISECPLTLMHCVGLYPCPEHLLNLQCIRTLQKTYGLPVGYSGHESSVSPSVAAVILGAVAVERHITLDRSMYGSDQAASLEPHGLVDTTRKIPNIITGRWSRSDIKHTSVYLPEAAYEALRQVAFDERRNIHDLLMECVELT